MRDPKNAGFAMIGSGLRMRSPYGGPTGSDRELLEEKVVFG